MLFIFLIICCLGCDKQADKQIVGFKFKPTKKVTKLKFRGIVKPGKTTNIFLKDGCYGKIEWLADEGTIVASGEVVAKIDMHQIEKTFRNADMSVFKGKCDLEKLAGELPYELANKEKEFFAKKLDFKSYRFEKANLYQKKKPNEIWKIDTDINRAKFGLKFAQDQFQFQRKITYRGFSSQFDLKSKEIDKKSKDIELAYSKRLKEKTFEAPLTDEIAKIDYKLKVASGEIWLSESQIRSASITSQIKLKRSETYLEMARVRRRKSLEKLNQKVLKAPCAGLVIRPFLWGGYRFDVGGQLWPRVGFLQIASKKGFYIESPVDENISLKMNKADSVNIRFDQIPEVTFKGKVKSISSSPRQGRKKTIMKKFPVTISFEPGTYSMLIGAKASLEIDTIGSLSVYIPQDIVFQKDKKKYVRLWGFAGIREIEVEVDSHNADWYIWKNPPTEEGVLVY